MNITFNDGDSIPQVLESLKDWTVDLDIPDNTGYPAKAVCIVGVDESDAELVVCESDDSGAPLRNATWNVPIDLIVSVTVL